MDLKIGIKNIEPIILQETKGKKVKHEFVIVTMATTLNTDELEELKKHTKEWDFEAIVK